MRVTLTKQEALDHPMLRHLRDYIRDVEGDHVDLDLGFGDGSVSFTFYVADAEALEPDD